MNSSRKKYASTPTYGMQKRNFAKKQVSAQPTPTPDFMQQPGLDAGVPVSPFSAQSPFLPSQGQYAGYPSQSSVPPYFPNGSSVPQGIAPGTYPNAYGLGQNAGGYGVYPQQPTEPQSYHQPLGNSVPPLQPSDYTTRAQGFVPPSYPQGAGTQSPGVNRGEPVNGIPFMPQGMNAPGGFDSIPSAGYFQNAGFPSGGISGGGVPPYQGVPYASGNPGAPGRMNANGNGNGFSSQPYPGLGGAPAQPTPKPPLDMDKVLKLLLYGILPVLFVPCVFVTHTFDFLRYLFIILTVITLSVLWYRQSFSSALRTTLSVVYLALSIIVIALLVGAGRDTTKTSGSLNAAAGIQATEQVQATTEVTPPEAQETPAPTEDTTASDAEARLSTFMDYWAVNNIEEMVNLVSPSWASAQDGAAQALFMVISNRTPLNYTVESISGTAGDSSRTVTMSADIDKNNGKDPVRYRFMILMVTADGEWYVDPNSLATNDQETPTPSPVPGQSTISQSLAPRMTVTPIPAADTKLYYNADGGNYYHIDPNCSAVNSKYLPMTSFLYSELDNPPYSSLLPCLKCGAPTKSLGDLAAETTAAP
ncbi:MAG: hypothetical protein LLF96_11455 [Eubacteriales bacterium]|nr:hypothetical protein [Eubacteriales bacterium]